MTVKNTEDAYDAYLRTVNNPHFRQGSFLVHQAMEELRKMGMSRQDAVGWIAAWAGDDPYGLESDCV